jgi:predicted ester cyclase/uncharacterized protein YndB with AHSA1/START domain
MDPAQTRTITQQTSFRESPKTVYGALMEGAQHSAFTGAPAEVRAEPGGKFSAYAGHVHGFTLELSPHERIVQAWREQNWPPSHYSLLTIDLAPTAEGGTLLTLLQTGVPVDLYDAISQGWRQHYWTKMKEYFRDQKKQLVVRFVEEFKNRGNHDIVDEIFAADFVHHIPAAGLPPGRDGQKAIGKMMVQAFPDVHVTTETLLVDGDCVIERSTGRATHRGEFFGIPGTGKPVTWTENHIYRIADGKIAEVWSEADFLGVFSQISPPKPA